MDVLVIRDNLAINNVSADSVERAESLLGSIYPGATFIECPAGVGPGMQLIQGIWRYLPTQPVNELSRVEFLKRMPMAKRIAIRQAQSTDPIIEDIMGLFDAAEIVHRDDPNTSAALAYLVAHDYLTITDLEAIWH